MLTIRERNVNRAYTALYTYMTAPGYGVPRETRNGPALVLRTPLTTHYERPTERVLFDASRDANPFFHLMEGLWVLAGRGDAAWLQQWLPKIGDYADDDGFFHGAYGARLRYHWQFDQLEVAEAILRDNPAARECVLALWDPDVDLIQPGSLRPRDLPCNDLIKFDIRDGRLCMMVCCRSNDMIWGAYGANVVHFSMLQEYLAACLGVPVGWYEQISLDAHVYKATFDPLKWPEDADFYGAGEVRPFPLMTVRKQVWLDDLETFMESQHLASYQDPFFETVARPMSLVHDYYRNGDLEGARLAAAEIAASDWRCGVLRWVYRRIERAKRRTLAAEGGAA